MQTVSEVPGQNNTRPQVNESPYKRSWFKIANVVAYFMGIAACFEAASPTFLFKCAKIGFCVCLSAILYTSNAEEETQLKGFLLQVQKEALKVKEIFLKFTSSSPRSSNQG